MRLINRMIPLTAGDILLGGAACSIASRPSSAGKSVM